MKRNRLKRAFVVGSAALASLAIVVVATIALPPHQTADVAMPADDASPEQVTGAFIDALNAHDCDTAQSLSTPSESADAQRWCERVGSMGSVNLGIPSEEDPSWSGHDMSVEVVYVPVSFDLDWRPFRGDGSMPEGATDWGYQLARETPTSPWRIFGQGIG